MLRMRRMRRESILDVYELVLAGFLLVSPWLFAFGHGTIGADAWISATLVAVFSLAALVIFREWEEWINLILGLWILVSPWILGFQHTTAMRVTVGIGLLIAYLAILDLWLIHYGRRPERADQS